jgi:hypothetical protein
MGEKRKKYKSDTESKKRYNSKLSTFQIDKELHNKVKDHCKLNNIKVRDLLESIIRDNINN